MTAFSGMMLPLGGSVHTRLHASATMAPEMMEQGIRLDVESVRMKRRVI